MEAVSYPLQREGQEFEGVLRHVCDVPLPLTYPRIVIKSSKYMYATIPSAPKTLVMALATDCIC